MQKQHQSKSLKKQALKNINQKHNIIKQWIEKGIPYKTDDKHIFVRDFYGEKILDFYPTSLRKFYAWNGTQNCPLVQSEIGCISGTGTTTLNNNSNLKNDIVNNLNILKQKASIQFSNENKVSLLKQAEVKFRMESLQRSSAENKYIQILQGNEDKKLSLRKEHRAHQQTIKQLNKMLSEKEQRIIILEVQLSELRKTLDKVTTLKSIG